MWYFPFRSEASIPWAQRLATCLISLELRNEVVEESVVEVFAAEEGVAVGRLHLEDTLLDLQDADVESSATKIVNGDTKNLW